MLTAFAASAITLALTALIVDDVLERHKAEKWGSIGNVAIRKLSGDAFIICAGLVHLFGFDNQDDRMADAVDKFSSTSERPGYGNPPLLPEGFEKQVAEVLEDPKLREEMGEATHKLVQFLDEEISRWAAVMLQFSELAETLNAFGLMRECLSWTSLSLSQAGESEDVPLAFWVNLRLFFLLFSSFDSYRRLAFGEKLLFGKTLEEHDQVWGMPFEAQRKAKPAAREAMISALS